MDLELEYNKIINNIDKERNEMNIFVYEKEIQGIKCPICGNNINIDIDKLNNIININDNIKNVLNAIKEQNKNIINYNNNINYLIY